MRKFLSSRAGKLFSVVMSVLCIGCCFVCTALADPVAGETVVQITPDEAVSAAKGLFATVTGTLNFANIAKVLSIGIGAVIGIWLAWWGIRKLVRMLTNVLQKGRVQL